MTKGVLFGLALALVGGAVGRCSDHLPAVIAMAEKLAREPFQRVTNTLPESLLRLNYEQHQAIQFRHERANWRQEKLPFSLEFYLPGGAQKETVVIHEMSGQGVRRLPFDPSLFQSAKPLNLPADLGYAGFRLTYPREEFGEVASFLGASYFRMIGRGQVYGTSARGLAIDTGLERPEEFPFFKEFWVQRPERRDRAVTVWALLDSPSATGAYRFVIRPGATTVAQVHATVFVRRGVERLGFAPLTSMYWFGENSRCADDVRPEVHDADGLVMHTGRGEWIWRPLQAMKRVRVNSFSDRDPRGFGLLQRDRHVVHYQDLVGKYHLRANVWIKPLHSWGPGSVQLIQLPPHLEVLDNVVVCWVPAQPAAAGQRWEFAYELHWSSEEPARALARAVTTWVGHVPGDPPLRRFVVEFDPVRSRPQPPGAVVKCSPGAELRAYWVEENPFTPAWRLTIDVTEPQQPVELRAHLFREEQLLSETWTYTWPP